MNRAVGPATATTLPYYGWFVLAASALTEMLVAGATSYSAGLFVLPVQTEFGLSRADASSAVLIVNLGAIFMAAYAGRILDRYPIRIAVCAGAICFSLALAVIALTSSLWVMVVALFLPLAMGFSMLGPMTTATLASRWFFRRRGLALGIAAIATSGGGFVVVPLLSKSIESYGWRAALLTEAILFFVIVTALALLVLKDNPFKAGLGANPENRGRTDEAQFSKLGSFATGKSWPWWKILSSRGFWAPSLLIAVISGLCQVIVITAPPYGHQLGFAAAASAFLISAFSIAAALTKISAGVMADFWDKRLILFTAALFIPLAMAILCTSTSYWAIATACCLAGVSLGGALPTSAFLIAARFGAARFGSVIGWTYVLVFSSTIATVRFTGTMFDRSGSYRPAFAALLGFSLCVWAVALFADWRAAPVPP
jgi:MFS family permease